MSGMRAAVLALLLVAARQEDTASLDTLIDRLSDDRVEVRDAAVSALGRLDLSAVPELERRLQGLEPEPRLRLQEAVKRIQERFRILEYLPAYKSVSLRLEKASPLEALRALQERTGLPIDFDHLPVGRPVTLDLVDQTPLQALHAICREAMLGWELDGILDWRDRAHGTPPGRIRIHWVTERYHRPMANAFVRHYRVHATCDDGEQALHGTQQAISLQIQTAPGVRPHSVSTLKLIALTDERGNDLLPSAVMSKEGFNRLSVYSREVTARIRFSRPPGSLVRIGRLAGRMTFRYPKRVRWVRFRPLAPPFGQVTEGLGFRFILRGYEHRGTEHHVDLDMASIAGRTVLRGLEDGIPFDSSEIELLTASGESVSSRGASGMGNASIMRMVFDFRSKGDEAAAEVRIPWADEFVDDVVEFELRDIRGMNE